MSVGHVSRALEQAGIATVVIAIKSFEVRMKMMSLPRVVLTNELLGRPMGAPLDTARQTEVLEAALDLLRTAEANGAVREI